MDKIYQLVATGTMKYHDTGGRLHSGGFLTREAAEKAIPCFIEKCVESDNKVAALHDLMREGIKVRIIEIPIIG